MINLRTYLYSNSTIVFFLILLTFLTYINILPNKLFYDDEELIYKNAYVQDLRFFPKYFTENMIAGAGKLSNMYRPILLFSFALDHLIWGNNPTGYHLTSILLHAGNSIMIFLLLYSLFQEKFLAFLTSILFIVHPVQTEAVTYASGRTDPLSSLFILTSLLFGLSFLNTHRYQVWKYCLTLVFFILALLSKETAIIFPLLLFLATLIKIRKEKEVRAKLPAILIPIFLLDLIYIFLRLTVLNFSNILNFYPDANIYSQNLAVRFYTFTRVFFEYMGILLFPKDLIFARNIDYITSPFNQWVILFTVTTLALLAFFIIKRQENKLFLFALIWFFITILPVSGVIPINNIAAEHYLYLPSISFFLLISYIFYFLWQKFLHPIVKYSLAVFGVSTALLLTGRTIVRNLDWRNPITFYTKSLTQSPWHVPMRNNLAMTYAEKGELDPAIREYKTAISLSDIYPQTHHNLANVYKTKGDFKKAEEEYIIALKMDPNFHFSLYGLADLYQKTGEKEKLEEVMEKLKHVEKSF